MNYLKIKNDGVLDIRLAALMGGTTKAGDKYKIGQFGTGLKYTLAYLYRKNLDFHIYAGAREIPLHIKREHIAGTDFDIMYVDGERTSLTTQLGLEWSAWMIIRELWCNALDEGGADRAEVIEHGGEEGSTTFFIQISDEIREVLENWGKYFLHDQQPMYAGQNYSIHPGGDKLRLYKNGVLISEKSIPSLFAYDIKGARLNELREYQGSVAMDVFNALSEANEPVIRYYLENIKDAHFEGDSMDYDWSSMKFNPTWKEVIGSAKIIYQKAVDSLIERGVEIDLAGAIVVPRNVYAHLTKNFDGIGALRVANKVNEFAEIYDQALDQRIREALAILETCGYSMAPELKIITVVFGDKTKNAVVNLDSKEIMISAGLLNASLFQCVAVLIEENEHFNTGLPDCSRGFQQHFIDLFTKTLLDKSEVKL